MGDLYLVSYPQWRRDRCLYCAAGLQMSQRDGYHWTGNRNPPQCTAPTAEQYIEKLELLNQRWKRAVQGLTPGGSEFVDDPERCAAFIKARTRYPQQILQLREACRKALRCASLDSSVRQVINDALAGNLEVEEQDGCQP